MSGDINTVSEKTFGQLKIKKFTNSCFEWIESIILTVIVTIFILAFVFRVVKVDGKSMMNTLLDKDRLIITKLFYEPKNGDIVAISHGEKYDEPIIKRVIAVEGQSLSIDFDSGEVVVNGKVLNEPYIKTPTTRQKDGEIPSVIPEGYIFVMGDNRDVSLDSRSKEVGLIDKNNVLGKARFIIYPFSRIGVIE